jgi:ParB family chromosome partitioning protein
LSALLGEESAPPQTGLLEVDIDLIEPNPEQPRTRFAESALDELAQSIKANGIVQPVVVRQKDGRYQIVAGERRWRAAQRAALRKIPVVVKDVPDDRLLEIALIENIQRQELNPIEEANAYQKLILRLGMTQEMIAERVGKDRTLIATTIRLLKLPDPVQRYISEGRMSAGHGRALLMTELPAVQRSVANSILEFGLSVRETEKAVKRLANAKLQTADNKGVNRQTDPNYRQAEDKLTRHLSTKVRLVGKGKKGAGKIEIEYYDASDLNRLYDLLMMVDIRKATPRDSPDRLQ